MKKVFETDYSIKEIGDISKTVLNTFSSKIILVEGEMGSGKTTLIKSLVNTMGSDDEVGSPTFSLVNEYDTNKGLVYHFDLYRIKNLDELYDIGFEDYLVKEAYVFIEWPEKAEEFLLQSVNRLTLKIKNRDERRLKLSTTP